MTIEDPKVFTRPWKMRMVIYRHTEPGFQLLEYECYTLTTVPIESWSGIPLLECPPSVDDASGDSRTGEDRPSAAGVQLSARATLSA